LQHEDGQAWAEAETGQTLPEAQQRELQEATASCTISESAVAERSEADDAAGATDITDLDLARKIIQECSVIVGIHPDQVRPLSPPVLAAAAAAAVGTAGHCRSPA